MKLIIHAGLHKTATTSFQQLCKRHADILNDSGINYPNCNNHYQHSWLAWLMQRRQYADVRAFFIQALRDAGESGSTTTLISGEDFENVLVDYHDAARLEDFALEAGFREIQWIFVTRSSSDYLDSLYAELSKHGFSLNYAAMAKTILEHGQLTAMNHNYCYRFVFDINRYWPDFCNSVRAKPVRIEFEDFVQDFAGRELLRLAGVTPSKLKAISLSWNARSDNTRLAHRSVEKNYLSNFIGNSKPSADRIVKRPWLARVEIERLQAWQRDREEMHALFKKAFDQQAIPTVANNDHSLPETTMRSLGSATTHLARALLISGQAHEAFDEYQHVSRQMTEAELESELNFILKESQPVLHEGPAALAIARYQDIIELMGEATPPQVYRGISDAYARNKEGFGGSEEQNHCWGDCSKHTILKWLHKVLAPDLYLEIGVDKGISLSCARGAAIGVDPRENLQLVTKLPESTTIIHCSSDQFFREKDAHLTQKVDFIFIDGMHLFEFALRDFIHAEAVASKESLIAIDDIYPCHRLQSLRRRCTQAWTGDVWKLHAALKQYRPDLTIAGLNAHTTGLLLVTGLDPSNQVLRDSYHEIVGQWKDIENAPEEVIQRHGALPSSHPLVLELIELIRKTKYSCHSRVEFKAGLDRLKAELKRTEDSLTGKAYELRTLECQFPDWPDPKNA